MTEPLIRGKAAQMKESAGVTHVSFVDAVAKEPPPPGNLAVPIFARGSLVVELYQPVDRDPQKPLTRDEVPSGYRMGG